MCVCEKNCHIILRDAYVCVSVIFIRPKLWISRWYAVICVLLCQCIRYSCKSMVWVAALQCKDLVSVYFSLRYRRRVCLCINYSFVVWVAALQCEDVFARVCAF